MAKYVRKGSVHGRRDYRGKGTEVRMSVVYPGSLKYICCPGVEALTGQAQEGNAMVAASTGLPI